MRLVTILKHNYRAFDLPATPHVGNYNKGNVKYATWLNGKTQIELQQFTDGMIHVYKNGEHKGQFQSGYCGTNTEMATRCIKDLAQV